VRGGWGNLTLETPVDKKIHKSRKAKRLELWVFGAPERGKVNSRRTRGGVVSGPAPVWGAGEKMEYGGPGPIKRYTNLPQRPTEKIPGRKRALYQESPENA